MQESIATLPERPVTPAPGSDGARTAHEPGADASLVDDPHLMQILSTEHWSLLSARSLAYNEAFTRAGMFLTFLSMSFVALALLAQAMGFTSEFLGVVALVIGIDFVIGMLTFIRLMGTGREDLRAMQGMNRIRQAYVRMAPQVKPFLSVGFNDDIGSVWKTYGFDESGSTAGDVVYAFSTSHALVGVVMALVGGVEGAIIALILGMTVLAAAAVGIVSTLFITAALTWWAFRTAASYQAALEVRFPTVTDKPPAT